MAGGREMRWLETGKIWKIVNLDGFKNWPRASRSCRSCPEVSKRRPRFGEFGEDGSKMF